MSPHDNAIAVIGMACRYPGAKSILDLWQNILARRQQFRRIPEERLPLRDYYSADTTVVDKTYGTRGAFIDGFDFDWPRFRIPKPTVDCTDIAHWVALEVATQAMADTNYKPQPALAERSGVILGNTLTGEFARAFTLRLRWPFVRRALEQSGAFRALPTEVADSVLQDFETRYRTTFPPTTEDYLAGSLSNTIAGRICSYFDFGGGGYTVDGACSSSLLAVCTAANLLAERELDMVVAGGVDISIDPLEIVGFAKTRAFTPDIMRVYDQRGNGFIPGEGCGFVVMKRLDDALQQGDAIYAVLRGWGVSSDGRGAITAPKASGQARAIRKAFVRAGIKPSAMRFVEGHGTGTRVGDKMELGGLAQVYAEDPEVGQRHVGITSLKSVIGHTKAAAGIGAVIKVVMALNRRVVPPTANCETPNDMFAQEARMLYPLTRGHVVDNDANGAAETLFAGASAMGFGGINSHVILSSFNGPSRRNLDAQLQGKVDERALLVSSQASELFVVSAASAEALRQRLRAVYDVAEGISVGEMVDLAAQLVSDVDNSQPWRAACIAAEPEPLRREIETLLNMLNGREPRTGELMASPSAWLSRAAGITPRLGFLYPGQASQRIDMCRVLMERHPWARRLAADADAEAFARTGHHFLPHVYPDVQRALDDSEQEAMKTALENTAIAQPALALTQLVWTQYLARLGVTPNVVAGHSLGELTAFYATGRLDAASLLRLAAERGRVMAEPTGESGEMVALGCDADAARELIAGVSDYAVIANLNSVKQTVVACAKGAMADILRNAATRGVRATRVRTDNGYHSRFMAHAATLLRSSTVQLQGSTRDAAPLLYSTVVDGAVSTVGDLREHFARHVLAPVDFVSVMRAVASHCDVLVEVGVGSTLTTFTGDTLGNALPCLPVETRAGTMTSLQTALAQLFLRGVNVRWDALYEDRLVQPFVAPQDRVFIVDPCENGQKALQAQLAKEAPRTKTPIAEESPVKLAPSIPAPVAAQAAPAVEATVSRLIALAAERTGFPADSIKAESRLLDDLNLDSIKAGDFVAAGARLLGAPLTFDPGTLANGSLTDIAAALTRTEVRHATVTPTATAAPPSPVVPPSPVRVAPPPVDASTQDLSQLTKLVAERTGFPLHTITPDSRLLDDLNLDSIKAGELVGAAAKAVGAENKLDPSHFANARLREIAAALAAARGASQAVAPVTAPEAPQATPTPTPTPTGRPAAGPDVWVREFAMDCVVSQPKSPNPSERAAWRNQRVLLVVSEDDNTQIAPLRAALRQLGANITDVTWDGLRPLVENAATMTEQTYVIAVPPRADAARGAAPTRALTTIVENLWCLSTLSVDGGRAAGLAVLQLGDGQFGTQRVASPAATSAGSFVRTLHLERPQLRVRIIDVDRSCTAERWAMPVLDELLGADTYRTVGFDAQMQRRVRHARMLVPAAYASRPTSHANPGVILVTGGAKGITAECSLALGRSTGARVALVGSSPFDPSDPNDAVAQTMRRFIMAGVDAHYYTCDLSRPQAVQETVTQVRRELGNPDLVVHGAGRNHVRLARDVKPAEALDEMAPKVLGLLHLLDALGDAPPKHFVALTSVIGVTGMPGNAWYAFANEYIDLQLAAHAERYPQMAVTCLAYSVWDEVGMGKRPGTLGRLAQMGIEALPKDEGVARFLRLVQRDPGVRQPVLAARLGGLDTWPGDVFAVPANARYLEGGLRGMPGVQASCRTRLTVQRDRCVADHVYNGSPLFPTVIGLEAMAQLAAASVDAAANGLVFCRIEAISLRKPLVVSPESGLEIELHATRREAPAAAGEIVVDCGIRAESSGFARDHFSATFVLTARPTALVPGVESAWHMPALTTLTIQPDARVNIDPKVDLYNGLLFQGPLYQRIESIATLSTVLVAFRARSAAANNGDTQWVGDAFLRDALLQTAQLVVPQDDALPVRIDRIELGPVHASPGERHVHTFYLGRQGNEHTCCIVVTDAQGNIVERIIGYRQQILAHHPTRPSVMDILNPGISDAQRLRRITGMSGSERSLHIAFNRDLPRMNKAQRHTWEAAFVGAATREESGSSAALAWNDVGRPHFDAILDTGVSLSHDGPYLAVIVGRGEQGCDLQTIETRSEAEWTALLTKERSSVLPDLRRLGDAASVAATRVWSASEAFFKATGERSKAVVVLGKSGEALRLQLTGETRSCEVSTWKLRMARGPERILAVVDSATRRAAVAQAPAHVNAPQPSPTHAPHTPLPWHSAHLEVLQEPRVTIVACRSIVTLPEVRTVSAHVAVSQLAAWMGRAREMSLFGIAEDIARAAAAGTFTVVTNYAAFRLLAPIRTMDVIETRFWASTLEPPSSQLDCEFWRLNPDGSRQKVGEGILRYTMGEIVERGIVKKAPFPPFLARYLDDMGHGLPTHLEQRIAPAGPAPGSMLHTIRYTASLDDTNAVGNIYFSEYFKWANKAVNEWLVKTRPNYVASRGLEGELVLTEQRIDFLREAMPYDTVEVEIGVTEGDPSSGSVKLYTQFNRIESDGQRTKLAVGTQRGVTEQGVQEAPTKAQTHSAAQPNEVLTTRSV